MNGYGRHYWEVDPLQVTQLLKVCWIFCTSVIFGCQQIACVSKWMASEDPSLCIHTPTLTSSHRYYMCEILYLLVITLIKASILALYVRIVLTIFFNTLTLLVPSLPVHSVQICCQYCNDTGRLFLYRSHRSSRLSMHTYWYASPPITQPQLTPNQRWRGIAH